MKTLTLIALLLGAVGNIAGQVDSADQQVGRKRDNSVLPTVVAAPQKTARRSETTVSEPTNTPTVKSVTTHANDDTEVQRKLVRFTFWLVLVGGLQFVALVAQGIVFFFTLRAINSQALEMQQQRVDTHALALQAVRQTQLTQAQLELSHRPWVSVEVGVASNLIFDQRGVLLALKVKMSNVGHSVAKFVSLWTE